MNLSKRGGVRVRALEIAQFRKFNALFSGFSAKITDVTSFLEFVKLHIFLFFFSFGMVVFLFFTSILYSTVDFDFEIWKLVL